jgi:hypothetical protein
VIMRVASQRIGCLMGMLACVGALAAEPTREVHGAGDAYTTPGVALAWGVVRGATEASTTVVVRIIADPAVYAAIAVTASNPFSQKTPETLRRGPLSDRTDVRVPRSQFADTPRTEWAFYPSATPAAPDAPALVVFYLGVPDSTPEFASEAALDAYLIDRFARLRAAPGGK